MNIGPFELNAVQPRQLAHVLDSSRKSPNAMTSLMANEHPRPH